MTLLLTVPEAAASADTIQFKLVLGGEGQAEYMAKHQLLKATAFRSFQQISWLHDALGRNFPLIVIPPLPEPPLLASMDDQDYVERKRLQVGRLLEKIIKRKVLADHPDFIHFLSSDMAPTEIGKPHRGVLSFLRFNRIKPSERGFTAYKASPPVEGDDQETYYRHQIYILTQESYYGSIAEYQNQIIQLRESLGDGLAQMGDQVIETTQSKYRLGEGNQEKSREVQRGLDRGMQVFGLLMDELGFIFTRQGKEEIMKFGDVMIEYKNFMDSLKIVFNVRTQHLIEYAECVKHRNKKKERSEKVKSRLGPTSASPEVQSAIVEEQEATDILEKNRLMFDTCQKKVTNEMRLFESQKRRDIKHAIAENVRLHLRYEKAKLENLEKALETMRAITQQPVTFVHPILPLSDEEIHSSASSVSYATFDTTQAMRRSTRRKRREKSKVEPHVLQSSASLPTWTRKQPPKPTASQSTVRVSPFTQSDGSRVHLSASYDERLGKKWKST